MNQGSFANYTGKKLEDMVSQTFEKLGLEVVSYNQYKKAPHLYGTELLLKNVDYLSIFNHQSKSEFLLRSEKYNLNIRIECKWQQSPGSVDEKYPYLYHNCLTQIEEDVIIIADGGGAKPGAIQWLRTQCEQTTEKSMKVFTVSEFKDWVSNIFGDEPTVDNDGWKIG